MPAHHAFETMSGATLLSANQTVFRLWAPSCTAVSVEIEGIAPFPMSAKEDGFFEATVPVGAGARYRFRVSETLAVPDPASRWQPEGVHGPSEVVDPRHYTWSSTEWNGRPWEEAVIYEVHVGVAGGYAALISDLPRIRDVGFTAIELMPLSEFPGERNWGYDGVLPYAPESSYGRPDELKALIDAAHAHGLMIFLDVVYNHFGPDGNYLNAYAEAFFHKGEPTPWGDAIDFSQPAVRQYFTDNALYWLMEYRFDGLRLDAVQAINDRTWLTELHERVQETSEPGRHVHIILENENNDAALLRDGLTAQWNDDSHNVLHVLLTGEHESYYAGFTKDSTAGLARVLSDGFLYQGQDFPTHKRPRGMPSGDLPSTKFIMFLQNHDQIGNRAMGERLISLSNPQALKAAYALLLLSPQIPMMFMGEDWGTERPFLFFTSHNDELGKIVRDGRRKEFADFSHFNDPARRDSIPDPNALSTFEQSIPDPSERERDSHRAWTAFVTSLLGIRASRIVPHLRDTHSIGSVVVGDKAVIAGWRLGNGAILKIALNLGDDTAKFDPLHLGEVIYSTDESVAEPILSTLAARSVIVSLGTSADE